MVEDVSYVFQGVGEYFREAIEKAQPFFVAVGSMISYLIFPDAAYVPAVIGLGIAMLLDIITKYYAISVENNGYRNARRTGAISSRTMWEGTKRKLVSYAIMTILCGVSVRVAPIASAAVFLSTVVYTIMFLREAQSCAENMVKAGHTEWSWIKQILQSREQKMLEKENILGGEEEEQFYTEEQY